MEDKTLEMKVQKSEDKPIYINGINITSSYFDFQFIFSNNSVDLNLGTIDCQELVKIIMSPQHAKATLNLLLAQITIYEEKFGALVVPQVLEGTSNAAE